MDIVLTVLGAIGGGMLGGVGGYRLGERVRDRHAGWYWALNVVAFAIGLIGEVFGLGFRQPWLYAGSLVFVAGAFTGLKYGRGKVVGPGSWTAPDPVERELPPTWRED